MGMEEEVIVLMVNTLQTDTALNVAIFCLATCCTLGISGSFTTLKMDTLCSCEMLVHIRTTRRYNPGSQRISDTKTQTASGALPRSRLVPVVSSSSAASVIISFLHRSGICNGYVNSKIGMVTFREPGGTGTFAVGSRY
jgi:hypothetical protein